MSASLTQGLEAYKALNVISRIRTESVRSLSYDKGSGDVLVVVGTRFHIEKVRVLPSTHEA